METILEEIESAAKSDLWYAALVLTLTLPDICAWLEAPVGASTSRQKSRYIRWCNKNFNNVSLDGTACWDLRSGVVHQGMYRNRSYDRIIFTVSGHQVHGLILEARNEKALSLSAEMFCDEVITCVKTWYNQNKEEKPVADNLNKLVRKRPDGLSPIFSNVPTIY